MNRIALSSLIAAAMLAVACGSNDSAGQSPTAPTTTTPPATTPAPPSTSCAPPIPSGFTLTQTGSSTRVFTWNASANAVDYFIGIGSQSGAADLIYTNTTQTTFTWTGQSVTNAFYYARVYARNSCGSSNWTTELTFH